MKKNMKKHSVIKHTVSSKAYLQFILEQLSDLEEITYRAMMGNISYIIVVKSLVEYMMTDYL